MKRTLTLAALSFLAISAHAQFINYTTAGTIASQNFDSLAASGSSNTFNQGTTINGFYAFRSYLTSGGGSNNSTYAADGGTGNAGNFYSYGTSTQTERAWGAIGSTATGTMVYGFAIQNLTGQTLTQFRLDLLRRTVAQRRRNCRPNGDVRLPGHEWSRVYGQRLGVHESRCA
jgi:hypothetical protein